MKNNNKLIILLSALALYFLSTGISFFIFSQGLSGVVATPVSAPKVTSSGTVSFDDTLPKTQECPLNGAMYSKQQEAWWQKHRPLGVMTENHEESRPQSGLSKADVVYEIVAEGGITRFLAVYYCQDGGEYIGPIRSARTYFIDFISEYGNYPLYAHVGGAAQPGPADALGQLDQYGWHLYNDLSQFSVPFPIYKKIDARQGHEVASEHTMYSKTQSLWDYAAKNRKLTNVDEDGKAWDTTFVQYAFKNDAPVADRGASQVVHIEFWGDKDYDVDWKYDPKTNLYARNNGGAPHIDVNTKKQITAKTIVVMYMVESHANDGYENNVHLLYKNKGTGKAVVLQDGEEVKATWSKKSRTDRTIITDASGKEIKFNRGLIWFTVLPTDGVLDVK